MNTDDETRCPMCDVFPGERHVFGCELEPCTVCGRQVLACDHYAFGAKAVPPEKERIPWSGEWPGVHECREFGWYACLGANGWESCAPDDPSAREDFNRLYEEAVWDQDVKRWREGFILSTSRFELTLYAAREHSPRMHTYQIKWKRPRSAQVRGEHYETRDQAKEAGLHKIQAKLGWSREKLLQFIDDEKALEALGGRIR